MYGQRLGSDNEWYWDDQPSDEEVAYFDGQRAAENGDPKDENTHPEGSELWVEWNLGYDEQVEHGNP